MAVDRTKPLRDGLDSALAKGKLRDAVGFLLKLEGIEPGQAKWPHKLGDVQRKLNQTPLAVAAYERAVDAYVKGGFVARALAMAKTVTSIDPSRTDVIARIQQEPAKEMKRRVLGKPPAVASAPSAPPQSIEQIAAPLAHASDERPDEVRFTDLSDSNANSPMADEIAAELSDDAIEFLDIDDADDTSDNRVAERLAALPTFSLFTEVPQAVLTKLAEQSSLVELDPGAVVIRTNEPADSLYAIVSGSVRVNIPGMRGEARILREGEVFGEACLLNDEPRHADVIVETPLSALHIPKTVLDELVQAHPEVGNVLINLLTKRLIVNLLKTSPLFTALELDTRREIARMFELRRADDGTQLVSRGKRSDGMYVGLTGRLGVTDAGGVYAELPAGSMVGQASLLSHEPAAHDIRTVGHCVLLRLPAGRFMDLITQYPTVLEQLAALLPSGVA